MGEALSAAPAVGDTVIIASLGSEAAVVTVDNDKKCCFVMAGSLKIWVDFDDLRLKSKAPPKKDKPHRTVTGVKSSAERVVSGELDLRGFASDEAIMELDRYIDEAVLTGINVITIIHGKGTGTLRKAVQSHLKNHKSIKSYRLGTFGEGENGVTIAEIK